MVLIFDEQKTPQCLILAYISDTTSFNIDAKYGKPEIKVARLAIAPEIQQKKLSKKVHRNTQDLLKYRTNLLTNSVKNAYSDQKIVNTYSLHSYF